MRWPAKLGIALGGLIAIIVLGYIIMFPVHNWRLKHRIWVAFGVPSSALHMVELPVDAGEGPVESVPALQRAAEIRFPVGTLASDVSNSLVRVFGSESIRVYER